jgi:hypothetical protein
MQNKILTQNFSKKLNFLDCRQYACGQVIRKKYEKYFFASVKSVKKGVGYGSGSISQRYGSGDPDADPH